MSETTKTVYVYLEEEGVDVWRPTKSVHIKDDIYKIAPLDPSDMEIEEWEFEPGSMVHCEERVFPSGSVRLVAVSLAQPFNR